MDSKTAMNDLAGLYVGDSTRVKFGICAISPAEGESWHPCFDDGKILMILTLNQSLDNPFEYGITIRVEGSDDYCIIKGASVKGYLNALMKYRYFEHAYFDKIKAKGTVHKRWLLDKGFEIC